MKSQGKQIILTLVSALALTTSAATANTGAPGKGRQAPPEAVKACQGQEEGAAVTFTPRRPDLVEGVCTSVGGRLVAVPEGGPMGPGFGRMHERMAKELGLNENQKKEIKAIHQAEREKNAPLMKKLAENRKKLHEVARAENFDEAAVRAIAGEQAQLQTELIVSRARVMHQVQKLLTPEQRAKAETMMERWGKGPGKGPRSMPKE